MASKLVSSSKGLGSGRSTPGKPSGSHGSTSKLTSSSKGSAKGSIGAK